MKLVIKIGGVDVDQSGSWHKLAQVASQLISDGHRLTMVHGDIAATSEVRKCAPDIGSDGPIYADMPLGGNRINRCLVASMAIAGVPAFGLCGADGNMIRARNQADCNRTPLCMAEIATFDPFWIDAISKNGGVPVIAAMALGPDRQYHCLDANQLASECAIAWEAHALVLLTRHEGIMDEDGSIARWFEAERTSRMRNSLFSQDMLSELNACSRALKHGVKRARILPASEIESLSLFYFSRIDFGTEVILGVDQFAASSTMINPHLRQLNLLK